LDSWVFFLVFCLVSILGIPVTIYHARGFSAAAAISLNVVGSVVIFAGFTLSYIMPSGGNGDGWGPV
jgi:hypothetical protein